MVKEMNLAILSGAAIVFLVAIDVLIRKIREGVFRAGHLNHTGWRKWLAGKIESQIGFLNILYLWAIFIGCIVFVSAVFSTNEDRKILEGIVLGFAVVTFKWLQMPRLAKPRIFPVLLPYDQDETYIDTPALKTQVLACTCIVVILRVTNLSMEYYKRCTFWVGFQNKHFSILGDDHKILTNIEFRKSYTIQKRNNMAVFQPDPQCLDIASGNHIILPIAVLTPCKGEKCDLLLLCATESRWGEGSKTLKRAIEVV